MRDRLMAATKATVVAGLSATVLPILMYRHEVRRRANPDTEPLLDWEELAKKIVDRPEWAQIISQIDEQYGTREDFDYPDDATFH